MTDTALHGTVTSAGKDLVWVRLDDGTAVTALVRKKSAQTQADALVPGDRVGLEPLEASGAESAAYAIGERLERRSEMRRYARGRERAVAANLDDVVIVQALTRPTLDDVFVDTAIASAARDELETVLVVTKIDLADDEERERVRRRYAKALRRVCFLNGKSGEGVPEFIDAVRGRVAALVGPSGVGKSTLWNAAGGFGRVGDVSKHGYGRHTTTMAQALSFEGGLLFDLPGVARYANDFDEEMIRASFSEFEAYAPRCFFRDCKHFGEPKCAVRAAVEQGAIDPDRYAAYRRLAALAAENESRRPSWG
ncbi:MAG TPA: ribosome small subunit-dependent GTPase A [Candidatus Elarobacter sp.]|jgi:ribosome biogenesis GTPase